MSVPMLIALPLLAAALSSGLAQTAPYPVKMEATAVKPDKDGYRVVRVTLVIEKGHLVCANPVGNEDLAPAQTTLKMTSGKTLTDFKVTYPKGEVLNYPAVGEFMVYQGTVVLQASFRQAHGDPGPLEVHVRVHPANDVRNFLPKTLKQVIP